MFSIIIPAFNEQNAISDTIKRCQNVINLIGDSSSEVIVVDDGSSDDTMKNMNEMGVKTIHHPHNIGYGRSLKDGIKAAKNDIIIITDADGTYPIESIPQLLNEYQKGFDMVVGNRQGQHLNESFSKKIFRRILKSLVEYTAGRKIPDINSGLRIFSQKTSLLFFEKLCDTFSFTTSLTLAYMMTGKFVKYIPIEYNKRIGKTKVKHFRDSLRTLQYITEAILYYNPIKIFIAYTVCLLVASGIIFGIHLLTSSFTLLVISLGLFFISFIILSFGFLAIQIKQISPKVH